MVNNFSVDLVGLYINWANTSLCIIPGELPTLNLPTKSYPSLRWLSFSDVILVLNYRGCKEDTINLIPQYLIDIVFSTLFVLRKGNRFSKNSTCSFDWRTEAWVKMHRFNTFSRSMNIINWKNFPTHDGVYKSEKIQQALWREIKP